MARYYYYKKYYYRRRGYRRNLYKYFYNKNKSYANRAGLNYYKAKINVELSVWKKNTAEGNQGEMWVIGQPDWSEFYADGRITIYQLLRNIPEYKLYIPLYDQVMLTGILVQSYPCAKNNAGQNMNSHIPISIQFTKDEETNYSSPLVLNPMAYSKKYFKNITRKWTPTPQSPAQGNVQNVVEGSLVLNAITDNINQTYSPAWNLMINFYLKFKKNKNN